MHVCTVHSRFITAIFGLPCRMDATISIATQHFVCCVSRLALHNVSGLTFWSMCVTLSLIVGHCMIWVEMVTLRHMGTMGAVRTPPASPSTLPSKIPSQVTDSFLLYQDMHGIRYRARDITALFIAALARHMCCASASCSPQGQRMCCLHCSTLQVLLQ